MVVEFSKSVSEKLIEDMFFNSPFCKVMFLVLYVKTKNPIFKSDVLGKLDDIHKKDFIETVAETYNSFFNKDELTDMLTLYNSPAMENFNTLHYAYYEGLKEFVENTKPVATMWRNSKKSYSIKLVKVDY